MTDSYSVKNNNNNNNAPPPKKLTEKEKEYFSDRIRELLKQEAIQIKSSSTPPPSIRERNVAIVETIMKEIASEPMLYIRKTRTIIRSPTSKPPSSPIKAYKRRSRKSEVSPSPSPPHPLYIPSTEMQQQKEGKKIPSSYMMTLSDEMFQKEMDEELESMRREILSRQATTTILNGTSRFATSRCASPPKQQQHQLQLPVAHYLTHEIQREEELDL